MGLRNQRLRNTRIKIIRAPRAGHRIGPLKGRINVNQKHQWIGIRLQVLLTRRLRHNRRLNRNGFRNNNSPRHTLRLNILKTHLLSHRTYFVRNTRTTRVGTLANVNRHRLPNTTNRRNRPRLNFRALRIRTSRHPNLPRRVNYNNRQTNLSSNLRNVRAIRTSRNSNIPYRGGFSGLTNGSIFL